jgi:hypothetical protein
MCIKLQHRVADTLLPVQLIEQIRTLKGLEKMMMAVATLIVNLTDQMMTYIDARQPKGFDAFPGDRICQARLIVLPDLMDNAETGLELKLLKEKITARLEALKQRKRSQDCSSAVFFEKQIASLEISRDVLYLLDCRLLMVTRATQKVDPNGIVFSRADYGNLSMLSPTIELIDNKMTGQNFREQIMNNACSRVSAESMARLQEYGRRMKIPPLLQKMCDVVRVHQPDIKYPAKTFGCQFFTMQLALCNLLDRKAFVAIKTIVHKDLAPRFIFFKAGATDFQLHLETNSISKSSLIAIFHAVVSSEDALISKIKEIGFTEIILRYAAQEDPFEHGSRLDDVKDPEGRAVLEEYKKKAAESGCLKGPGQLLLLHHLYCNTFQEEVK